MKSLQLYTDKLAIGLSLLCTIHCLAFPLLMVLLPSIAALQLNDEAFHLWMVFAVIPTSAYALTMGCKQHKRYHLLIFGLLGVFFLVLAILSGETFLTNYFDGELMEKVFTCIGAGFVAYGHYRNYRLCKKQDDCECPENDGALQQ